MKNYLSIFLALALLFSAAACTPEQKDPEGLTTTGEALDITEHSATLTGYLNISPQKVGNTMVGIMYDKDPSFENGQKIRAKWVDKNNMFGFTVIGLESSTTYYYKSYDQYGVDINFGAVKSFTTKDSQCPEGAVDLGVVVIREDGTAYTLYWAKSNLSADGLCANPEDAGDYYAWGETEPKSSYSWATYKFGNGEEFTKYNTTTTYGPIDHRTVLDLSDDAARAILGGKWRMPTEEEWEALRTQCSSSWRIQNGVKGQLVTASNGNSIFLPAVGYRYGSNLNEAERGSYWSSSLYTVYPGEAWRMYFYSGFIYTDNSDRDRGLLIRPVTE